MQKMLQNFQAEESSHEAHPHFKIMDFIPSFDRKGGEVLIPIPFLIYYMYIIQSPNYKQNTFWQSGNDSRCSSHPGQYLQKDGQTDFLGKDSGRSQKCSSWIGLIWNALIYYIVYLLEFCPLSNADKCLVNSSELYRVFLYWSLKVLPVSWGLN